MSNEQFLSKRKRYQPIALPQEFSDEEMVGPGHKKVSSEQIQAVQKADDLSGATGRIRAYGVFHWGCVDCANRGEICTP